MIRHESSLGLRRPLDSRMGTLGITRPCVGSVVDFDGREITVIVGGVLDTEFAQTRCVLDGWTLIGTRARVACEVVAEQSTPMCEWFWLTIREL